MPISEETRQKMSLARKGKKLSDEQKRKLSEVRVGKYHFSHKDETKKKISATLTGKKRKPFSEEHIRHLSESHKGLKQRQRTQEHCRKISEAKIGKKHPPVTEDTRLKLSNSLKGRRFNEEHRNKIAKANKGKRRSEETRRKQSESLRGEKSPHWKGGITPIHRLIRKSLEYRLWRLAVFARDNYCCIWCGTKGSRKTPIHADHIKPFALFPELRFAIDNGRTLCFPCHKTTPTYGANCRPEKKGQF